MRVLSKKILIISTALLLCVAQFSDGQATELQNLNWKIINESAVPKVAIKTKDNERVRFNDLITDDTITIVNFWATWCEPCIAELPDLQQLHRVVSSKGVRVILVNSQEDPAETEDFLRQLGITLTSYYDTKGKLGTRFGIRGMPSSFMINRNKKIFARYAGIFPWTNGQFVDVFMSLP